MSQQNVLARSDMAAKAVGKLGRAAMVAPLAALLVSCGGTDASHREAPAGADRWTRLTLKCEDQDARGRPLGPAILSNGEDARDYDADWHTRADARRIARRLHLRYTEDC
jgi:hypothetical protein